MKYSDLLADWLAELGYTHCFFLAGGNIALRICWRAVAGSSSASRWCMRSAPAIAAEYFNELSIPPRKPSPWSPPAPGLTNVMTAIGGSLPGKPRAAGHRRPGENAPTWRAATLRQRGIQEIDGVAIAAPGHAGLGAHGAAGAPRAEWQRLVSRPRHGRAGPGFHRDAARRAGPSGRSGGAATGTPFVATRPLPVAPETIETIAQPLRRAPSGRRCCSAAGVDRALARSLHGLLAELGIPLLTSDNGAVPLPRGPSDVFQPAQHLGPAFGQPW